MHSPIQCNDVIMVAAYKQLLRQENEDMINVVVKLQTVTGPD